METIYIINICYIDGIKSEHKINKPNLNTLIGMGSLNQKIISIKDINNNILFINIANVLIMEVQKIEESE